MCFCIRIGFRIPSAPSAGETEEKRREPAEAAVDERIREAGVQNKVTGRRAVVFVAITLGHAALTP
jgi:hypothetical protein